MTSRAAATRTSCSWATAGDDIITTCDGATKQLIGGPGDDFMSSNVGSGRVDLVGGDGVDEAFLFAPEHGDVVRT